MSAEWDEHSAASYVRHTDQKTRWIASLDCILSIWQFRFRFAKIVLVLYIKTGAAAALIGKEPRYMGLAERRLLVMLAPRR